jgi:hypothetical protein
MRSHVRDVAGLFNKISMLRNAMTYYKKAPENLRRQMLCPAQLRDHVAGQNEVCRRPYSMTSRFAQHRDAAVKRPGAQLAWSAPGA